MEATGNREDPKSPDITELVFLSEEIEKGGKIVTGTAHGMAGFSERS